MSFAMPITGDICVRNIELLYYKHFEYIRSCTNESTLVRKNVMFIFTL